MGNGLVISVVETVVQARSPLVRAGAGVHVWFTLIGFTKPSQI